jgi:hypothetical protein
MFGIGAASGGAPGRAVDDRLRLILRELTLTTMSDGSAKAVTVRRGASISMTNVMVTRKGWAASAVPPRFGSGMELWGDGLACTVPGVSSSRIDVWPDGPSGGLPGDEPALTASFDGDPTMVPEADVPLLSLVGGVPLLGWKGRKITLGDLVEIDPDLSRSTQTQTRTQTVTQGQARARACKSGVRGREIAVTAPATDKAAGCCASA